jgi:cyclophilin family peptidyl-prolyl cis-trans isomerase
MGRLLLLAVAVCVVRAQDPSTIEAVFETELGSFRMEFFADKAPRHVAFFLDAVRKGSYAGSGFHRVYANALVQGGDPLLKDAKTPKRLWGTGGLKLQKDEFSDLKHERGTVSAVSIPNTPDSDGLQFFVLLAAQPAFDGKYSAFGRVTEGLDTLEKISNVPKDANGIAEKPVRILKATIEPKKWEPFLNADPAALKRFVTMETTLGTVRIEVMPEWAPENARNFLKLCETGWYVGTPFHRIVKGFVVQGGTEGRRVGSQAHAADRWVRPVRGEFQKEHPHVRGILSMARNEDVNSATTSFFFVLAPSPHLDGQYSAFARIVAGMEVLEAFEKEEIEDEAPKRRLEITAVRVER